MSDTTEPVHRPDRLPIITLGAGVAVFVLGCIGLTGSIRSDAAGLEYALDVGYGALQLFVLDGASSDEVVDVGVLLQFARFLAPLVTVLAILLTVRALLADDLRRRRIAAKKRHTVVCGGDATAIALAQNLGAAGRDVVLITPTRVRLLEGTSTVVGDPRQLATLKAAGVRGADALYALADSSASNAAVVLAAGSLRADSGPRLATFAHVRSDELVDALRVQRLAANRPATSTLDFFALDEIAARMLLQRHPPGSRTPVLLGFSALGRAVLRSFVRSPSSALLPQIIVAGVDDTAVEDESRRLGADDRGRSVIPGEAHDGDGPVYVCLADEDEAISTGLRLARDADHADRQQPGSGSDIVVCLRRASPFREALAGTGRLKIFGVLDVACTEDAIAGDSIVARTARAIHERYLTEALERAETAATNPSAVRWDELTPHLKESNRGQAEHIGVKLAEIGASLSIVQPATEFRFTEQEVEQLAIAEHARWKKEREDRGFRHGPSRSTNTHPDLVDWPDLNPTSKAKDIAVVRNLPALLADEGLYIVRGRSTGR
jgi:voltage-gated potassium channel Kch